MLLDLKNTQDRERFTEYGKRLMERGAVAELKELRPNRTRRQNSYLHLLLGYFASEYGCSREEAKIDFYKRTCNRELFAVTVTNRLGHRVETLRSTAELTTEEMAESIERFRNWSARTAEIYLPAPYEEEMLLYAERRVAENRKYI